MFSKHNIEIINVTQVNFTYLVIFIITGITNLNHFAVNIMYSIDIICNILCYSDRRHIL